MRSLSASLILALLSISFAGKALDVAIINVGESEKDARIHFKNELVELALQITKPEYGDFEIIKNKRQMNTSRAFRELQTGHNLSVAFAHTNTELESMALPVRVSLRKGLDSYRLLLVKKGNEHTFSGIKNIEDLKKFKVGLSPNWATYKIMQAHGFDIADASIYASMFKMLEGGRFDFLPRALHEVHAEVENYEPKNDGLAIVPNVALFIPSATYMFVSPKTPRLFKRLNSGVHALNTSGQLADLIDKHYKPFLIKADIQSRQIIKIQHSELTSNVQVLPAVF